MTPKMAKKEVNLNQSIQPTQPEQNEHSQSVQNTLPEQIQHEYKEFTT